MSLESGLHRLGQLERELKRAQVAERVEAQAESWAGRIDFALCTGAELDEFERLLRRLAASDVYVDRDADAAAVLALVQTVNARDTPPAEPGGRSRWFRPHVSLEEVADEVETRSKGHHRVHVSEGVSVTLAFDPEAAPVLETPKPKVKPSAPARTPAPVVEKPAGVVSTSGRVTRILRAKTVEEQRAERAASPEQNPLVWRSQTSRRGHGSSASEIVEREF